VQFQAVLKSDLESLLICPNLSTFYYIQSSKPIMSSLPEGLPLEIKKALQAIDFKFDAEKQSNPFYFVSYSEVKMRGWNTAANDLKENLIKVLDLVQKDQYLRDKDNTIRILSLNIERLDLSLDFYSEDFLMKHKTKYLRTVRKLTRPIRPKSLREYRYDEVGKLRKLEPSKKARRKITIPEENFEQSYATYLIDFEKENYNPNCKAYIRLFKKIDPKNLIRNPISEIYEFFNNEVKCVYKNKAIRKNSLVSNHRFLKDTCSKRSKVLTSEDFPPFSYIAVPDFLIGKEQQIMTFYGAQFAFGGGGGGNDYYDLSNGAFKHKKRFPGWSSSYRRGRRLE
jgi:hypothetical protein